VKSNIHLYLKAFISNGKYLFYKDEKDFVIMPAVGDAVEFDNNVRTIIIYSDITLDEDSNAQIEVYTLENDFVYLVNKKGRQKKSLSISPDNSSWPISGASLIRDGVVIYPVNFKYKIINNFYILFNALKNKANKIKKSLLSFMGRDGTSDGGFFKKCLLGLKKKFESLKDKVFSLLNR
jgi:hypothetical protein